MPTIGVLALQGAFNAHARALKQLNVQVREIRLPQDLDGVDGVVLPGGESTTMSQLLLSSGVFDVLTQRIADGLPALGTCAGLILLAKRVLDARPDQVSCSVLDVTVRRNGYGRQIDSFEADIVVTGLETPLTAVFIRAPIIEEVGSGVEILAMHNGAPVAVASQNVIAASFHPELTSDVRFHELFLHMILSGSTAHGAR
ncbi:MAG: pyridoxal 5'-phosphate synthase glutaminase subunit PdxT [Ilumatobacteraceae bacterium]|nr:pyridoxal 5'-phosphate synthase glutaminase subunit PdxT [Ilumatobacteraceae bacterium]